MPLILDLKEKNKYDVLSTEFEGKESVGIFQTRKRQVIKFWVCVW